MNQHDPQHATSGSGSTTDGRPPLQDDAKQAAEETKGAFSRAVHDSADELRHKAEQAKHAAAEKAKEASRYVKAKSARAVHTRQVQVGEQIETFAAAISEAGNKIREGSDPRIADLADSATRKLQKSAEYLKKSDPAELANDARGIARQYPELVFGGLFVLGLAAARFLKSSDEPEPAPQPTTPGSATAASGSTAGSYATYPPQPSSARPATASNPSARTSAPPSAAVHSEPVGTASRP